VTGKPLPVFTSSGQRGYSNAVGADPRRVAARKLEREIDVRFTPIECTVQTSEGLVHAAPGDAIITGTAGEHWRVSRARFPHKYRPVPPTVDGEEEFEVILADGVSRLTGRAGEWLVDYGDGSLGIVSEPVFATTYEITA
jgi:hypothetical protein